MFLLFKGLNNAITPYFHLLQSPSSIFAINEASTVTVSHLFFISALKVGAAMAGPTTAAPTAHDECCTKMEKSPWACALALQLNHYESTLLPDWY